MEYIKRYTVATPYGDVVVREDSKRCMFSLRSNQYLKEQDIFEAQRLCQYDPRGYYYYGLEFKDNNKSASWGCHKSCD